MKILHVLDHSLPHYDGYAFRSAEIIRFEQAIGIETVQVTSPKHAGPYLAQEIAEGIEFHRTAGLGGIYRLPLLDQTGVVVALRRRLLELVEATRPDLIHAHSPSLNGLAALSVARRCGLPFIYEVRSFWEDAAVDAGACREGDLRYRLTRASETYVAQSISNASAKRFPMTPISLVVMVSPQAKRWVSRARSLRLRVWRVSSTP
jgi:glycosyltransferase involved in cell wall biosynthesis